MAEKPESVAFEPHADKTRVVVAVQTLDRDIELEAGEPYVTNDPGVIQALDQAEHVKRVAKGETKTEAREKAEEKATAGHVADRKAKS